MFQFVLNGQALRVERAAAGTTLLDFLRERGLTGAKEGCAEGECGACAVAMRAGEGPVSQYRAVNSCLMLLPMAADRELYTVEALAVGGQLAAAQQAMAAAGGSQCGYCTPGFVMSLFAEHYRPGRRGPCDPLALAGNLCRCTGYRPIADAARSLGPVPRDAFSARLLHAAPKVRELSIEGFSRPRSIDACVALLARHPHATLIAGGTDLCVESNLRHRRWPHLVSLEAIDQLREFADTPEFVRIGAALPLADLGARWHDAPEVIGEWLTLFGSPLIRNRATLGGNLVTASPVGDAAPLLLALDASVEIAGASNPGDPSRTTRRMLPLSSLFTGYRRTALLPGELVVAVRVPRPLPRLVRFYKVAKRRLDDISTVAAAMAMDAPGGRVQRARFAFGGVAATPVRLREAESVLDGQPWNMSTVERVQAILERTLTPLSDHRGSKEYRVEVSKSLVEKFWWESRP
ncbi:MAG: xanthine dehydrogenase small subunit [Luteitalea sp.]|nr:FAD binding domain-containing protein [Acidobacteriota bacterium]